MYRRRQQLIVLIVFCLIASIIPASASAEPRAPAPQLSESPSGAGLRLTVADIAALELSPRIGPDIPISELDNIQHSPAVAYNSLHNEYLVVWHNEWGDGKRDLYAQRISGQGELLSWFAIADQPNDQAQASVAYDPEHDRYLVVWIYDTAGDGSNWDIYGRFIPWNGGGIWPAVFPVCTWSSSQWVPQVVYNENPDWPEFLVVWNNQPSGLPWYVSGRRIFSDGTGFPPGDGFTVAADPAYSYNAVNPDVAYNLARNEYLVVYSHDQLDIYGARLEANGNILSSGEFPIATWPDAESLPAVAACHTADQYLVVWQSFVNGTDYDIYGRFVDGAGTVEDVKHLDMTTANNQAPDVACNPRAGHYMVVWEEQYSNLSGPYGVWGQLIRADKSMGRAFGIVGSYTGVNRTQPAVAAGSPSYLTVWEHDRGTTGWVDIHGSLVWPAMVYLPFAVR